jgi:hypothetical protein
MKYFLYMLPFCLLAGIAHAANQVDIYPASRFAAAGDLDGTTDVSLRAANAAGRHCVTGIQVSSLVAGSDQTVRLLSADTVIWSFGIDTALSIGTSASFLNPICTAKGEALEIDVDGNPTDDLIIYSVQGYSE